MREPRDHAVSRLDLRFDAEIYTRLKKYCKGGSGHGRRIITAEIENAVREYLDREEKGEWIDPKLMGKERERK